MDHERVTLGEVYRLCLETNRTVKEQNSRVRKLEQDNIRIKAYWSSGAVVLAVFGNYLRGKLGL